MYKIQSTKKLTRCACWMDIILGPVESSWRARGRAREGRNVHYLMQVRISRFALPDLLSSEGLKSNNKFVGSPNSQAVTDDAI